jgi:hypothetical protein
VTVPRLLSPLLRTRARRACTLGLLVIALVAASLPWWPRGEKSPATRPETGAAAVPAGSRDVPAAMAEATRTGAEVLVDTATTATELTWARPDGQLHVRVHAVAQRARNAAGRWADIDTTLTLVPDAPGGLGVRPVNPPTPVRFSSGGAGSSTGGRGGWQRAEPAEEPDTTLAEVDIDGHTIAYAWPGPLPTPVLDGARALYPEVRPGVDLLLVARQEGGLGQLLIVKNRAAAAASAGSLTYGLRSSTAIFRRDRGTGGVRILDHGGRTEIGTIPTPFGWDSAGQDPELPEAAPRTAVDTSADVLRLSGLSGVEPGARHAPLPTRLDGDGTGDARLHLNTAASGLLAEESTRFPVFLDPTVKGIQQAWATVYSQHPTTNTWNGTNFNKGTSEARVGYEKNTPLRTRSFWRMGFKNIKGATVSSADFKVLNTHSWNCTAREMQLWSTAAISSGTTWKKQPAWQTLQQKYGFAYGYSDKCDDNYAKFNIKNAAAAAAKSGAASITLGLRASSESDTLTWRKFDVKSAELNAVYNTPPTQPKDGTSKPGGACVAGTGPGVTVAKTDIVLAASAADPDDNLEGLVFRFWKNGTTAPAGKFVTAPRNGGRASLTIPSETLTDKATYSWDVHARDEADPPLTSTTYPTGANPCRITIDASAPPAPDIDSAVFKEATPDGLTWSTVKFGGTGAVTFTSKAATKFTYSFDGTETGTVTAVAGKATVPALKPRHSGPNSLQAYAYDSVGNRSQPASYTFYVLPRDTADKPGDTGGDERVDLIVVDFQGHLRNYVGDVNGDLESYLDASYVTGGKLKPAGHWYTATGKPALVSKHSDVYPGDGSTDLFARTPDGGFWLYPGDGYGSFNIDQRLRVLLPGNVPAPSTWTQVKAVGDVTGDKLPGLVVRAGSALWALTGYTGASFQQAILMDGAAWTRQEIVNVADVDLDGTPDLVWRHLDTGVMYLRHGKPGSVAGSVNLDSLKSAAAARQGDVQYGTGWSAKAISAVVGIPDVNGNRIPDMWVRSATDGQIRVYHPSATNTGGPVKAVITANWATVKGFG